MFLILPLAFVMGMPFPLGLQLARQKTGQSMIPLAWGINGGTAVAGSTVGVAVALLWGFTAVLLAARPRRPACPLNPLLIIPPVLAVCIRIDVISTLSLYCI